MKCFLTISPPKMLWAILAQGIAAFWIFLPWLLSLRARCHGSAGCVVSTHAAPQPTGGRQMTLPPNSLINMHDQPIPNLQATVASGDAEMLGTDSSNTCSVYITMGCRRLLGGSVEGGAGPMPNHVSVLYRWVDPQSGQPTPKKRESTRNGTSRTKTLCFALLKTHTVMVLTCLRTYQKEVR